MISPSFTMRQAKGFPPFRTFSLARETVRAESSASFMASP